MSASPEHYYVFADDHQVYGPADTEHLKQWTRDSLISPASWIYHKASDTWCKAEKVACLKDVLQTPSAPAEAAPEGTTGLRAGQLRRIRLFAEMTDAQVEKFISLVKKVKVKAFASIVKHGESGDFMFLILEGEARVSLKTEGKEDIIATLGIGDFFGEISFMDAAPRSADVIANKDCTLLELSKKNFEDIMQQDPELASRFLIAINRFLGTRIRATNDRFTKAQNLARSTGISGQITPPAKARWVQ